MKVYQTVERAQAEIDEIVCNICGRPSKKDKWGYREEYVEICKKWGYNSEFDGEVHSLELCPDCYKKIIGACKIPITITLEL